jgi:hypothetical protein
VLVLILIAVGITVAALAAISLLDAFVLRPKNLRTARRLLEEKQGAAERPRTLLKRITGWDAFHWNNTSGPPR